MTRHHLLRLLRASPGREISGIVIILAVMFGVHALAPNGVWQPDAAVGEASQLRSRSTSTQVAQHNGAGCDTASGARIDCAMSPRGAISAHQSVRR
jgi:hypothetical protein